MSRGYYGSNGQEWPHGGTPTHLIDSIIDEFGEVFDPCPNDPTFDGLGIDWPLERVAFVNPPYTRGVINKWIEKAHHEALRGVVVVMLIPSYTDTVAFHKFIYGRAELRFLKGRLQFKGYDKRAAFPSMLVIFNKSNSFETLSRSVCLICGNSIIQCTCEAVE